MSWLFGSKSEVDKLLLNECKLLPKWVKKQIKEGWYGKWKGELDGRMINGYLYLYALYENEKINDEMIPELIECIKLLGDKIQWLNLQFNKISSKGAILLFDALKETKSTIRNINLDWNQLDDKCMKSFGEYVQSNSSLMIAWIGMSKITDIGIEILVPYLDGNTTLKYLSLYDSKDISDKSVPFFVKMIESSNIEQIDVGNTSITQRNLLACPLTHSALKNKRASLNLSYITRNMNDCDFYKVCELMKAHGVDNLKTINFGGVKITSERGTVLFDTLRECNAIVSKLYLFKNLIDDECMKSLGEYLHGNNFLDYLNLSNNKISDKGIDILMDTIIGNNTLKEFHLNGNEGITNGAALCFIDLAKKTCITRIDVDNTSMTSEKKQQMNKLLTIPCDQRDIIFRSNTKSAAKGS